ncbi:MAG TPA: DUF72 domain-containing protein [Kiritimatiellae bacterium]|nr:DUF72 domain-containing protein [Kiritimatiellia bacterium]
MDQEAAQELRVGTSGWYYRHWAGRFYPAELKPAEWLEYYTRHFSTVEINATFYRMPFENMIKGWSRKAPTGFLYAVKGNRRITHLKKLAGVDEDIRDYFRRVELLGEHLGPVLWQLPPSLHEDYRRLEAFLKKLPRAFRHAVEFRHPSWLQDVVFEVLRRYQVACVSISSSRMPANFTETADFVYYRFHGLKGGYAHDYSRAELGTWAEHARSALERGKTVFAFFNNDAEARAPGNASELIRMIVQR